MFAGLKKFVAEVFQDVDGGFSAKRTILFVMLLTFVLVTGYVVLNGVVIHAGAKAIYSIPDQTLAFLQGVLDKCVDGIKWIVGAITAERVPAAVSAYRGKKDGPDAAA